MIRSINLILALAFSVLLMGINANAQTTSNPAPSFDCAKATSALEKLICSDPEIAAADAMMAKLYALAQVSAFGSGASNQLAAQREWMSGRAECMKMTSEPSSEGRINGPRECLASDYRERNRDLAVAILLSHPDVALEALKKGSPQIAPLYEALQIYLTKPQSAKWSDPAHRDTGAKVAALLEPFYADLKKDDNKSYGLSVLSDIAASPADAMADDAKMGSAIGIISIYVNNDEGNASFPFPCAAIIKRPAMISASAPYFGSTLDNFLPRPDCEQSLPAQPRMDGLVKELNRLYWSNEDCDGGTIRFAYYRSYDQIVVSARAGLPIKSQNGESIQLVRKGLRGELVTATLAELSDQYQRYIGLSKAVADKRARFWLGRMIADAGVCET
jgi:uncharacterized protein YecT (DUF1311 family)